MSTIRTLSFAAMLMAGSFAASHTAYAEPAHALSGMDRAELAQLDPGLRANVEGRLTSGQTVHGVLETMLLNRLSNDFASGRIMAADFSRGDIVVEGKSGQMQVFPFDVETLQLRG